MALYGSSHYGTSRYGVADSNSGLRTQRSARFTTMVKDTIINAGKAVFQNDFDDYPDPQFQEMRWVPEHTLTKATDYPAVNVRFQPSKNTAAGIGHEEFFYDEDGWLRRWRHRLFWGSIDFNCIALSPLDRDILVDTIYDLLGVGDTSPLTNNFFTTLYGDPTDPSKGLSILQQLVLSTEINSGGNSEVPVAWGSEDLLEYRSVVSVDCFGGYYNSVPENVDYGLVSAVYVYPNIWDAVELEPAGVGWDNVHVYADVDTIGITLTPVTDDEEHVYAP